MNHRWLVIRLAAPVMAFGTVAVDHVGPTLEFPGASMMAGLMANALGLHWSDREAHQDLQDRAIFAARCEREARILSDTQNVQLSRDDQGWTTLGTPQKRRGQTYGSPHRRLRDYLADQVVSVVLRLNPADAALTLQTVAEALDRPARPLYIGRKSCLPASRLMDGWVQAETAYGALCAVPGAGSFRALWPLGEGPQEGPSVQRIVDVVDLRDWRKGLHVGCRAVVEGWIEGTGSVEGTGA